jgi:tight adherence protein C
MPLQLLLALIGVFGAVGLGVGYLSWYLLSQTTPERRRLERAGIVAAGSGVLLENTSLTGEASAFAQRMTTVIPRSPKSVSRLRKRFMRAGYQSLTPVAIYSVAQIACPLVLGLIPLMFGSFSRMLLISAFSALLGYLIPGFVLEQLIKKRQKVIQNGLPDALDLMIVCLEAGSAIDQAMVKVSDELALAYPALAEEFQMLITETRAGKPRIEAFRNFADRTGVDDVRALVAMLVQTDRFGTSVSQALRTHAETSRTKRRQRAEERAAKIGVKLVFPLVFCLFPAMFVVTLGPAVIKFVRILFGQILGE